MEKIRGRGERRGRRRRRRRKRYVFILKSCVFWISKVLVWRLVAPCSRVLWRDHINLRILKVLWEKP